MAPVHKKDLAPLDKLKKAKISYLTGFTLMEVLVSLILIALTLLGLSNLFVAGKRYIQYSRTKMTGGELGKIFLDPLQMDVTQAERSAGALNGWGQINNCLNNPTNPAPSPPCPQAQLIDNVLYTPDYDITPVGTNLRRVKLTISWPKVQP